MIVHDNRFIADNVYDYWKKNGENKEEKSSDLDDDIIPDNKHLTASSQICLCFDSQNRIWLFGWLPNPYDFENNTEQDVIQHMYKNNHLLALSSMQHINFNNINNDTNTNGKGNINIDIENKNENENDNGIGMEDNLTNISPLTIAESNKTFLVSLNFF